MLSYGEQWKTANQVNKLIHYAFNTAFFIGIHTA